MEMQMMHGATYPYSDNQQQLPISSSSKRKFFPEAIPLKDKAPGGIKAGSMLRFSSGLPIADPITPQVS